jgi:hypothetical protein
VPVHVENFTDVASLSLKLGYDTNILVYTGYQNLNPALGNSFLMNGYNNQVIMSWFSLSPASIGTGILLEIKFFYTGNGNIALAWNDMVLGNCVYTNLDGTDLPAVFIDGYIHGLMHTPTLVLPPDQSIGLATNPLLNWTGSGCSPLYQVEIATDSLFLNIIQSYPSVFGTSLTVQGLNLETTYYWHVKAFNALHTTEWSALSRFKTQDLGININDPATFPAFTIAPNPASKNTLISIRNEIASDYILRLFNPQGLLVWQYKAENPGDILSDYSMNTDFLPPGIYFLAVEALIKSQTYRHSLKLVITNSK